MDGVELFSSATATYHVDELRKLELDAHSEDVRRVDDGAHQLVIAAEQVVVQTLGVGVAGHGAVHDKCGQQPRPERFSRRRRHGSSAALKAAGAS